MRLKALRIMSVDFTMSPSARSGSGQKSDPAGRRSLILALGASMALTACGRKGDLELPPVEPVLGDDAAGEDVSGNGVPGGDSQ